MFLLLAILVSLLALYLLHLALKPLLDREVVTAAEWDRLEDDSVELIARRDRLVDELRDLESEAALSKLDPDDLLHLRGRFEREALEVVSRLDDRARDYTARIASSSGGVESPNAEPSRDVPATSGEGPP
jgi:hypothetical protein